MVARVKPIPLSDARELPFSVQEWMRQITNLLYSPTGEIPIDSIDVSSIRLNRQEVSLVQQAVFLTHQADTQRILSQKVFSPVIEKPILSGDSQRILETQIFGS